MGFLGHLFISSAHRALKCFPEHEQLCKESHLIKAFGAAFDENVPTAVIIPPALQVHHLHAVQIHVSALQPSEHKHLEH